MHMVHEKCHFLEITSSIYYIRRVYWVLFLFALLVVSDPAADDDNDDEVNEDYKIVVVISFAFVGQCFLLCFVFFFL